MGQLGPTRPQKQLSKNHSKKNERTTKGGEKQISHIRSRPKAQISPCGVFIWCLFRLERRERKNNASLRVWGGHETFEKR